MAGLSAEQLSSCDCWLIGNDSQLEALKPGTRQVAGERFTLADSRPPIPGSSLTLPARKRLILYGVELGRWEINILTLSRACDFL